MEDITIEPLQPSELPEAVAVVSRAFSTQPNIIAVLGERPDKKRVEALFKITLGRMPGQVLVAKKDSRIVGVLRMVEWPQCQISPIQGLKLLPTILKAMRGAGRRGLKLRRVWAKHAPKKPHWHIDPIGVEPELQGQGIGSLLLTRYCEHVDALSQASYLETDRPENVPLYERFGYAVIGEESISGVTNWFMWRPPRQKAS